MVWLSNVVHAYSPANIRRIFARAFAALSPGGILVLRDFMLDDSKTEPPFAALFALNMLVATGEGGSYSENEYRGWLAEAGFTEIRSRKVEHLGNTQLLLARGA
jgi:hypothetical protein